MIIGVNNEFHIKYLSGGNVEGITYHEVDRQDVFGDKTDFTLLHYCYESFDGVVKVYPRISPNIIEELEKINTLRIPSLEQQIELQEESTLDIDYRLTLVELGI